MMPYDTKEVKIQFYLHVIFKMHFHKPKCTKYFKIKLKYPYYFFVHLKVAYDSNEKSFSI